MNMLSSLNQFYIHNYDRIENISLFFRKYLLYKENSDYAQVGYLNSQYFYANFQFLGFKKKNIEYYT